jgi:hypothetical protein
MSFPELSMNATPFTDYASSNSTIMPLPHRLYPSPEMSTTQGYIVFDTLPQFEAQMARSNEWFFVFAGTEDNPIFKYLTDLCLPHLVIVKDPVAPQVLPTLSKFFKTHMLRVCRPPFTPDRIMNFVKPSTLRNSHLTYPQLS